MRHNRKGESEMGLIVFLGGMAVLLFTLNWFLAWRHNDTDRGRGTETWQGWDDGHGGGGAT